MKMHGFWAWSRFPATLVKIKIFVSLGVSAGVKELTAAQKSEQFGNIQNIKFGVHVFHPFSLLARFHKMTTSVRHSRREKLVIWDDDVIAKHVEQTKTLNSIRNNKHRKGFSSLPRTESFFSVLRAGQFCVVDMWQHFDPISKIDKV